MAPTLLVRSHYFLPTHFVYNAHILSCSPSQSIFGNWGLSGSKTLSNPPHYMSGVNSIGKSVNSEQISDNISPHIWRCSRAERMIFGITVSPNWLTFDISDWLKNLENAILRAIGSQKTPWKWNTTMWNFLFHLNSTPNGLGQKFKGFFFNIVSSGSDSL